MPCVTLRPRPNRLGPLYGCVGAAVGGLLAGLVAAPLPAAGAQLQAATGGSGCADNWRGGSGSWTSANRWSAGVPTSDSVSVCVTVPGSSVTVLGGDFQIGRLVVGGSSGAPVTITLLSNAHTASDIGAWADSVIGRTGVVRLMSADPGYYTSTFGSRNGSTLVNDGVITVSGLGGWLGPSITNNPGGTINLYAKETDSDCCTVVNRGRISIGPGATWKPGLSVFTQAAGVIDNRGSMEISAATFNMLGGSVLHHPISLAGFVTLKDHAGTGPAKFALSGGNTVVSGTIAADQRIIVLGDMSLAAPPSVANYGTIAVTPGADMHLLGGGSSYALLNHGTLDIAGADDAAMSTPITNEKSGTINATGSFMFNDPVVNNGLLVLGAGTDAQLDGYPFKQYGTLAVEVGAGHTSEITSVGASPVTLGGILQVSTVGAPVPGRSFSIIQTGRGPLTGRFSHLRSPGAHYTVAYGNSAVTLTAH